jgi:hypothetical protein
MNKFAIHYYTERKDLTRDRQAQIDKIIKYRDSDDFNDVCHAWTGKASGECGDDNYVVLCGMDRDTIMHSYLVDKEGKNLIPPESGYVNPDVDIDNPTSCKVIADGNEVEYPYVELIKVSDL